LRRENLFGVRPEDVSLIEENQRPRVTRRPARCWSARNRSMS
jgi:hypothetical protein